MNDETYSKPQSIAIGPHRFEKDISWGEKVFLAALADLTEENDEVEFDSLFFAEIMGVTVMTIYTWIHHLAQQGYLKKIKRSGGKKLVSLKIDESVTRHKFR